MKRIKIVKDDAECLAKIDAVLKAVNGGKKSFAITDPAQVVARAFAAYLDLDPLPIRDRAGAVATYQPAGPSAKSYGYNPPSTLLTYEVGSDGKTLYLKDVESIVVYPRASARETITISPMAHAAYVAARSRDFLVRAPT